ncbi:MAG TPA: hypothetical protein VGK17_12035 [Propionicimonas sp.]
MPTYRIRWLWAVATSAPLPVCLGVMVALIFRPVWVGVVLGLTLASSMTLSNVRRVRRRSLSVSEAGLEVQRDTYAIRVGWDQVLGVQQRLHQGVIPVEELVLSGSRIIPRGSTGKTTTPGARLSSHPAPKRILISLYDKSWRTGPVGDHLRTLVNAR